MVRGSVAGMSTAAARVVHDCMNESQKDRVTFVELREYEFFARWRDMSDNGKRTSQKTDEDHEDEANKRLALSSSTHPIDALEVTAAVQTSSEHKTAVTTIPVPVQELAVLPPTPAVEDATTPSWMALIQPDSYLEYILAVAQMDPLNDPLGFVVGDTHQEVTDFAFLDQFDGAPEL
ncbi:hypothetical protein BGZ96_005085 [Linnemannia gamsii]|uniref:Uncharacterized protein n=1 Tax=Linnemannia gamsii TaxID=64522 RepID=A0ABQ7JHK1_9FUNG|nr:hypothetical protein BGZ96_005085 [Linnemannia gamsii]